MSDACHANTSTFARRKATSALSYLLSRVELIVKAPPVPSSLTGTFLVSGGAALDLLLPLAELSSTSSTVTRCYEEARLPEEAARVLAGVGSLAGRDLAGRGRGLASFIPSRGLSGRNKCLGCSYYNCLPVQLISAHECVFIVRGDGDCWCQNRQISSRGSQAVCHGSMGNRRQGKRCLPRFGPS